MRQGEPLVDVRPTIVAALQARCGGALCVRLLEVAGADENITRCDFFALAPPAGTRVPRGGTVRIVTGSRPCAEETTPGAAPDGGEPPTSAGQPTADETAEQLPEEVVTP